MSNLIVDLHSVYKYQVLNNYVRFPLKLKKVACLIQDVSPHCGDKRMVRRCTRRSLPNYFDMTSYHWNVRQNTVTGIGERTEKMTGYSL
jgi:hypothetical protein